MLIPHLTNAFDQRFIGGTAATKRGLGKIYLRKVTFFLPGRYSAGIAPEKYYYEEVNQQITCIKRLKIWTFRGKSKCARKELS